VLNVGWGEIGLVMLVALVVFGPNRLPEVARNMGKFMRQFQRETSRAMSDLKEGLDTTNVGIFDEPDAGVAADPVGAGAVEPVADAPPTRPLATTRRKTSTPPARRASAAKTKQASRKKATTKKTPSRARAATTKRPTSSSKSRRRA
jgi:sec-independent protein translocase protein TatB